MCIRACESEPGAKRESKAEVPIGKYFNPNGGSGSSTRSWQDQADKTGKEQTEKLKKEPVLHKEQTGDNVRELSTQEATKTIWQSQTGLYTQ